jgi:hypothetical protein
MQTVREGKERLPVLFDAITKPLADLPHLSDISTITAYCFW